MTAATKRLVSGAPVASADARQYRYMFVAVFLVFLMVAAVASLLGWRWRPWPPGPEGYTSIVNEAKVATNMFLPFAFNL